MNASIWKVSSRAYRERGDENNNNNNNNETATAFRGGDYVGTTMEYLSQIDLETLNLLLDSAASKGDINESLRWFNQIRRCGRKPDMISYSSVIRCFKMLGQEENVTMWMEIAETQPREDYEKGSYEYARALEYFVTTLVYLGEGSNEKAFKTVATPTSKSKASSLRFESIDMLDAACLVCSAWAEAIIPRRAEVWLQYAAATAAVIDDDDGDDDRRSIIAIPENELLGKVCLSYVRANMPYEAKRLLQRKLIISREEEKEKGPSSSSYSSSSSSWISYEILEGLLSGFAVSGDVQSAGEMLMEMEKRGIKPNVSDFNCVMLACVYAPHGAGGKGWNQSCAEAWLRRLLRQGLTPNRASFQILVTIAAKENDTWRAEHWLNEAHKRGIMLDVNFYNKAIYSCVDLEGEEEGESGERAEQLFSLMQKHNCTPNEESYRLVANAWKNAGRNDKFLKWDLEMTKRKDSLFAKSDAILTSTRNEVEAYIGNLKNKEMRNTTVDIEQELEISKQTLRILQK
mmetsp:Transcript_44447/g.74158  ORF Transcript_44447/g.74158 Transcript_44447/m.74158 type:complete len:516 (+) Transcript_44447:3-1550(+)